MTRFAAFLVCCLSCTCAYGFPVPEEKAAPVKPTTAELIKGVWEFTPRPGYYFDFRIDGTLRLFAKPEIGLPESISYYAIVGNRIQILDKPDAQPLKGFALKILTKDEMSIGGMLFIRRKP
jgi:hypothetical protein